MWILSFKETYQLKRWIFFDWTNSETNQISISFLNICFNILQEVEEAKVIKERQSEEDDLNELKRRDFRMKKQSRISTEKYIIMKHKLLKIQLRSPVDCVYTINREIKIQIKLGSWLHSRNKDNYLANKLNANFNYLWFYKK